MRHRRKTSPTRKRASATTIPKPAAENLGPVPGHPGIRLGRGRDGAALRNRRSERIRRTQLLRLKAEAELDRLEKTPPIDATRRRGRFANPAPTTRPTRRAGDSKPKPVDPEEIKAGYRKAIDLAPQAVDQMQVAAKFLKEKDRRAAYSPAEEARKILEEIQKSQPKNEPPQDRKRTRKKRRRTRSRTEKAKKQRRNASKKQNREGSRTESRPEEESDPRSQDKPQQVLARSDRRALRKVRERQQEKRDRDRKMKARVMGRAPWTRIGDEPFQLRSKKPHAKTQARRERMALRLAPLRELVCIFSCSS